MSGLYARTITRSVECEVCPTAHELAELFWSMGDDEQASFFNHLGSIAGAKLHFQLSAVVHHPVFMEVGREAMSVIGEYAEREDT